MSFTRTHFGGCSFVLPEGFSVNEAASLNCASTCGCSGANSGGGTSLIVTLTQPLSAHASPPVSTSPEDMKRKAYPSVITLTVFGHHDFESAAYLRLAETALQNKLPQFAIDFIGETGMSPHGGAQCQSSFITNFKIYRLSHAWKTTRGLTTATIMFSETNIQRGWKTLFDFTGSVMF